MLSNSYWMPLATCCQCECLANLQLLKSSDVCAFTIQHRIPCNTGDKLPLPPNLADLRSLTSGSHAGADEDFIAVLDDVLFADDVV